MNSKNYEEDKDALQFMHNFFPNSKYQKENRRYIADCPDCKRKNKFWWSEEAPYNGQCFACGYSVKSPYQLGYKKERKKKTFELNNLENLILFYRNKTGKHHRLSQKVVQEFNLKAIEFTKKNGNGTYFNIAIYDEEAELKCNKHLNFDGRWISVPSFFRTKRKWHNIEKIPPNQEHIFVLAGEWDLFSFWEHTGIHGISPLDGETSASKFDLEHYDIFSNKKVIILFDNDLAGRKGAKELAKKIQKTVKTKFIRVLDLSKLGLPAGGDIDDFFSSGGTKQRLFDEIKSTPIFISEEKSEDVFEENENFIERPHNKNTILDDETLEKIWRTVLLPESKRIKILSEIIEENGIFEEREPRRFKKILNLYLSELNTMKYLSFDILLENWMKKYHIKQAINFSEFSEPFYYFYEDGFYQMINKNFLYKCSEEMSRKISSPDDRNELSKTRKQMIEDMTYKLVDSEEVSFDQHSKYINFSNGTYDLKNCKLVSHSPEFLLDYKLPIEYNENAECPNFEQALDDWTFNAEDKKELLKALYYLISGDRSKSIVLWLYGEGNDGKSEFIKLCKALIGEKRTSSLAIETLEKTHYTAELYNKLLNIADEVPKNFVIPDAIFKRITGNSVITGDPKYKNLISFISKALWIIPSNHFPNVADTTHGYFRRFKIFKFKRISKNKEIPHFFETKLKSELPGIVNLILTKGRLYYEQEGFILTETEKECNTEMKQKNTTFFYWDTVFENFLEKIKTEYNSMCIDPLFLKMSKEEVKKEAILKVLNMPYDVQNTNEEDVFQLHKKENETRIICNINAHYKFYKEFYREDQVMIVSLSTFRSSTINFLKDRFPELEIEKIRIYSTDILTPSRPKTHVIFLKISKIENLIKD